MRRMLDLLSGCVVLLSALQYAHSQIVFSEWVALNYTWDQSHTYHSYVESGKFIVENCLLAGINVDSNGDIYVTVPRWRPGVPATLNKLVTRPNSEGYVLEPYPSWDIQDVGEEGDLQYSQSMTIDSQGRMWVIETGRTNFFAPIQSVWTSAPAGVWIIDMATREVTSKYYFPPEVAAYDNSFVNDIVLDEERGLAYLSDAWGDGALIMYNHKEGTSRRYSGASTKNDPYYEMVINGVNYGTNIFTTPCDGIAISDDAEALFYSAVQGTTLYRLPTSVFRDMSSSDHDIDAAVQVIGEKGPSDGMKYWNEQLYYGHLPSSTFYALPVNSTSFPDIAADSVPATPAPHDMRWVDTFAIDRHNSTRLWFVSNSLDLYSTYTMDFSGASGSNMRILYTVAEP